MVKVATCSANKVKRKRNCTICEVKTKALISCALTVQLICSFVFAYTCMRNPSFLMTQSHSSTCNNHVIIIFFLNTYHSLCNIVFVGNHLENTCQKKNHGKRLTISSIINCKLLWLNPSLSHPITAKVTYLATPTSIVRLTIEYPICLDSI